MVMVLVGRVSGGSTSAMGDCSAASVSESPDEFGEWYVR